MAQTTERPTKSTGKPPKKYSLKRDFLKGLWEENPVYRLLLGMCPTLAVTNAAVNGFSMGLATMFVLVSAATIVSLIKRLVPKQVRIVTYVVIIASFVTMADLFLAGRLPVISAALGPYVALIVVNCLILGRVEAFASRHPLRRSFLDALGMGLGFTGALTTLGIVREIFGSGSIFGFVLAGAWFERWTIMLLPPGAFLTLGLLLGLINHLTRKPTEEATHSH